MVGSGGGQAARGWQAAGRLGSAGSEGQAVSCPPPPGHSWGATRAGEGPGQSPGPSGHGAIPGPEAPAAARLRQPRVAPPLAPLPLLPRPAAVAEGPRGGGPAGLHGMGRAALLPLVRPRRRAGGCGAPAGRLGAAGLGDARRSHASRQHTRAGHATHLRSRAGQRPPPRIHRYERDPASSLAQVPSCVAAEGREDVSGGSARRQSGGAGSLPRRDAGWPGQDAVSLDRDVVCPWGGTRETPAGVALPSHSAPEPPVPLRAASGRSRQPRSAEGTVIHTLKFSGTPRDGCPGAVPEPPRHGVSRRVPVTLGPLSRGCTREAERGQCRTAGRAEGPSTARAAHSSRTPEPSERLTRGLPGSWGRRLLPERRHCGSVIEVWSSVAGMATAQGTSA